MHGVKAVVVACNTATGIAVDTLRARFALPIVAIEPAVKPAAARTRSGVVGVLATTQTLASERFSKLVDTHAAGVRVMTQPSPGLVEVVEAGELSTAATRSLVEKYVRPLVDQGADTIVLGCTHYPFLGAVIQDVAGSGCDGHRSGRGGGARASSPAADGQLSGRRIAHRIGAVLDHRTAGAAAGRDCETLGY